MLSRGDGKQAYSAAWVYSSQSCEMEIAVRSTTSSAAQRGFSDMKRKAHKISAPTSTEELRDDDVLDQPVKSIAEQLQQSVARQGEHAATGDNVVQMHACVWDRRSRK
jgi:hypothetical protein